MSCTLQVADLVFEAHLLHVQLDLEAGEGLMVASVVPGSPAPELVVGVEGQLFLADVDAAGENRPVGAILHFAAVVHIVRTIGS